jgi:hypothetical protein
VSIAPHPVIVPLSRLALFRVGARLQALMAGVSSARAFRRTSWIGGTANRAAIDLHFSKAWRNTSTHEVSGGHHLSTARSPVELTRIAETIQRRAGSAEARASCRRQRIVRSSTGASMPR